ncbi:metal-dependent hydrolase [Pseudogemmobacter sp. W21_MBD1_M6]|uniref:metal-dependent hydrolase n=1 Tax=Pseudogemmobacter sp. W21_MBD1_M6 TaxID=3240271 RepID=UPI003F9E63F1
MKITWLGHSGFRIEIADQVLLLDPWMTGNPMFPAGNRAEAIRGATHILLTHGHGDHTGDSLAIARELDIPVVGIYDLMSWWEAKEGIKTVGFNKGGTVKLGQVSVTLVNAVHSSSVGSDNGPVYAGSEAGFMISGEGHTIYATGDTDVMADMKVFNDLHAPDIGILCAGGHFTMDMRRAAYAAKTFFNFKTVIPCHYRTFPLLEQSADLLKAELAGVDVIEPQVMQPISI